MNEIRDNQSTGAFDDQGELDPREAARLVEQTSRQARRAFDPSPVAAVVGAGVFLIGYASLKIVVLSPFGRALGGIRENEGRMGSLGYNVRLYKLAAFTFAGSIAGYAGALACQQPRYFSPEGMSFDVSAVAIVVIVIGGQRSLIGAVLGSAFYYVVRDQLSNVLSSHWQLALGAVFVLVVYFLPGGLVGGARRLRTRLAR